MTALPQKLFTGEFPRLSPHDLPPGAAQNALNVDFTQGYLQGIKSRTPVAGVTARDATWAKLYEMLAEVEAGTRPLPDGYADVEPELPALEWPIA